MAIIRIRKPSTDERKDETRDALLDSFDGHLSARLQTPSKESIGWWPLRPSISWSADGIFLRENAMTGHVSFLFSVALDEPRIKEKRNWKRLSLSSLGDHKKEKRASASALICSFLFFFVYDRQGLLFDPGQQVSISNSWPGFSWHNDSECYRQEKIKEKVGQAVSVSRAYCGPHQEREKERPTWISSWRTQPLVQLFLHILLAFNLHLTVGHHNNKGKLMANRMKMKPTGEGKHLLTNLITTARPFLFHVITH